MSSGLSMSSEANALELLENIKDIFSRYYMHSDLFLACSNLQPSSSVQPLVKELRHQLVFIIKQI